MEFQAVLRSMVPDVSHIPLDDIEFEEDSQPSSEEFWEDPSFAPALLAWRGGHSSTASEHDQDPSTFDPESGANPSVTQGEINRETRFLFRKSLEASGEQHLPKPYEDAIVNHSVQVLQSVLKTTLLLHNRCSKGGLHTDGCGCPRNRRKADWQTVLGAARMHPQRIPQRVIEAAEQRLKDDYHIST
eukprot:m.130214 g.130214  ORF g.130214 m.130214 type:complete len:187 (+) comp23682_c1_seq4:43-603(+)